MLRRIAKILAYTVAALTVLLAIAVGLLRIALPQVPEYRDEIIARLSEAVDGDIAFDRLDARWRLRGPEIVFHDVVIGERLGERQIRAITVEQVTVGVSVRRLMLSRELEVRRIGITGGVLDVRRDAAGWWLQDALILPAVAQADGDAGGEPVSMPQGLQLPLGDGLELKLEDIVLRYEDRGNGRAPLSLDLVSAGVRLDDRDLSIDATMAPEGDAARLSVLVNGALASRDVDGLLGGNWSLSADLDDVSAALMRRLLPPTWRLPQAGRTDLEADAELRGGSLAAAVLAINADRLVPPDGGDESSVAGRVEWSSNDDGWLCAVSDFVVGVADRQWPAANFTIALETGDAADTLRVDAANVTVYDVPYLASFLPERTAETLLASRVSGTLRAGNGFVRFAPAQNLDSLGLDDLIDFEVDAEFDGIGLAAGADRPGASNLTGALRATGEAGRLRLDTRDATLQLPALFANDVGIDRLDGTLVWRASDRGISVLSDALQVSASGFDARANLQVLLPADGAAPEVDLQADWSVADISNVDSLLPKAVMKPRLTDWLGRALVAGRIRDGSFELRGALDQFPFEGDAEGSFRASGLAEGVTMRYGNAWPAITNLTASVALDGMNLSTSRNRGLSGNVPFENAQVSIEDLRKAVLDVNLEGAAALETLQIFAGNSPIRNLFAEQFDRMSFAGPSRFNVALDVPLRNVRDFDIDAAITVSGARFALDYLPHAISELEGTVRVDRQGVYAEGAEGVLLGQPLTIDIAPTGTVEDGAIVIRSRGTLDAAAITGPLELPLEGRVDGGTPFEAVVNLPRRKPDWQQAADEPEPPRRPVTVSVTSNLEGLAIDLPDPVGKDAATSFDADAKLTIGDTLDLQAGLTDRIDVAMRAVRDGEGAVTFDRMTLHLGEGRALLSSVPGVFIDGITDRLRLGDWLSLKLGEEGWVTENLVSAAVEVGDLYVVGQRIRDVRASLERSGDDWLVDVQSDSIEGAVSIPRDLRGGRPVMLDMRKLHLIEADPEAGDDADPTQFPPLRIRAASFALGDRDFGALDANIDKLADGLEVTRIATAAPAFSIEGTGAWRLAPGNAAGSRTTLTANLRSTDVKRMMSSLGYEPGINASLLEGAFDVAWDGGPRETFVASLDGDVSVTISDGTLDEVEPGAGRVVGLMSVAELPRRLALDFRDVFQKGFNFDEIVGDFRLVNGDAYTCNLRLAGPSADVALIGRASLDKRNYNQTAVVGVKVGNTLPAVGAVVAGPQVGAALLLFSQIFKKPLQGMTQVYYQINGSWDEPGIERTDAARFVATSEMAGCAVENGG